MRIGRYKNDFGFIKQVFTVVERRSDRLIKIKNQNIF